MNFTGAVSAIFRFLGRAIGGPSKLSRVTRAASATVAGSLAQLRESRLAEDLNRIRESLIRTEEAKAEAAVAAARKKTCEAADASRQLTRRKRLDRLARAEALQREANAAKTDAERQAILVDAQT